MTSSTSSSDWPAAAWRRWLATFIGVLAVAGLGLLAAIVLGDPYDTGRFALLPSVGVADESPRTANASRGRDPQFDAAIIGSSTGQLLHPKLLSQATGSRFVQLVVPGTRAREQLTLMRWFLRHHPRVAALVIVTDESWCNADATLPIANPFPFWLYSDSDAEYLANIFSARTIGRLVRQVSIRLGRRARSDPAGYWDYELGRAWNFHPDVSRQETSFPDLAGPPTAPFPAIDRLGQALSAIAADAPVVIVMPPVFFTHVPVAGTPEAARLAACKAALANSVARRARGGFLDYRVVNATTRDPENFMDVLHYRAGVARRIERSIAAAIATGRAAAEF
jgi:hypothetical protein